MRVASVLPPAVALALVGSACVARDDGRTSDGADTSAANGDDTHDSGSTSAATSAAPTDDSASDGAGSTTGAALSCVDRSECRLLDDCCSCVALHIDEVVPPSCDLACDRTLCQLWNTEVICSHTCVLRLVDCDPALVDCADEPPACGDGFQPGVVDRCWTQQCVPVELCTPY